MPILFEFWRHYCILGVVSMVKVVLVKALWYCLHLIAS